VAIPTKLTSEFDARLQLLLCHHCGALLRGALSSEALTCEYCNAVHVVPRATTSAGGSQPGADPSLSSQGTPERAHIEWQPSAERIAWARAALRDAQPDDDFDTRKRFPADLEHIAKGGNVNTWRAKFLPELERHWKTATEGGTVSSDSDTQYRVYWLASMLARGAALVAGNFTSDSEPYGLKRRAVLETALGCLIDTPYAYVARCLLARGAAVASDVVAARQWLVQNDPNPSLVELDGHFRVALAAIRSAELDMAGVLEVVGENEDEVPFVGQSWRAADAYRIHAYEQLGDEANWKRLVRAAAQRHGASWIRGTMAMAQVAPRAQRALFASAVRVPCLVILLVLFAIAGAITAAVW